MKLTIDLEREEDGRWIAEALELAGVMCYGQTRDEAISNTERLAIEVIADRIAYGDLPSSALGVSFLAFPSRFQMSRWPARKARMVLGALLRAAGGSNVKAVPPIA